MKYIIDFHNDVTSEQISSYLNLNQCSILKEWNNFEKIVLVESAVEPSKTEIVQHIILDEENLIIPHNFEQINFDPHWGKMLVPGLPEVTFNTVDTKNWWKNYILSNPEFDEPEVTISKKGQNISVYIMDSGIKSNLEEFDGVSISNIFTVTPENYDDDEGHGTALASVISGKTCGITNAKIKNVKIFRTDRGTYQSEFLSALDAIINDFTENSLAVLNCSWSIPRNVWIEQKMKAMTENGIIIVAAAGNKGVPIEDVTPAAMDEAITVGSYNSDLIPSSFSDYTGESHISYEAGDSNHGELDVWAPGENIWAVQLDGSYGYIVGTSAACAIASLCLAWNLSQLADETGVRYPEYNYFVPYNSLVNSNDFQSTPYTFYLQCASKINLLDLSNPKYQYSTNAIVGLKEISPRYFPDDLEFKTVVKVGENRSIIQLFNVNETLKVEIIEPLPANFFVTRDGKLHASPIESQGPDPSTEDKFTLTQTVLKITKNNGDVIERTVKIYILPADYNPGDLPEDHEINVTLLGFCTNVRSTCFGGGAPDPTCQDACSMTYECCGAAPLFKDDGCYCGMFS